MQYWHQQGLESTFSQGVAFVPVGSIDSGTLSVTSSIRFSVRGNVDMQVGLTGQSLTSSIGSVTVNDMTKLV